MIAASPHGCIRDLMAGRSAIEILSASLFHDSSRDRSFMVMTGHFDESGTHGGSSVVLVAGFIADVAQWANYERDLSVLNSEFGVRIFHAKEFRDRKGDFKGWPTARRAKYNSRFLQLSDEHLACGFATLVQRADYDRIYRVADFPRKARPDTPYGLCFRVALLKALLFVQERRADWPLNIIVEMGNKNIGDAIRVFEEIKNGLRPAYSNVLGYLSIGAKGDCLPLAAADALAYAVFRMTSGFSKHPTMPDIAAVVGPADPPYYVHKIPLSRTLIDENSLALMRNDVIGIGPSLWPQR